MDKNKFAFCEECNDLVEYFSKEEEKEEEYRGEKIKFRFKTGRCSCCGSEVATDLEYNERKAEARLEAYKRHIGIISIDEINEILRKYNIGKEALADIAGFGKVTIKRYYDGIIPSKEYSDILKKILIDEAFFKKMFENNKNKLNDVASNKVLSRLMRLNDIEKSKIDQIANYIITNLEEVTPLALQKLLSFSNGVNYALNDAQLIFDESQAWAHGPVYPRIYNMYKKYGYKPIDDGILSTNGCMLSKVSGDELNAIDLVIKTFGVFSPKTLERISHIQKPWCEKRIGIKENESGNEVISEESIKAYYVEHKLYSENNIFDYISECLNAD